MKEKFTIEFAEQEVLTMQTLITLEIQKYSFLSQKSRDGDKGYVVLKALEKNSQR